MAQDNIAALVAEVLTIMTSVENSGPVYDHEPRWTEKKAFIDANTIDLIENVEALLNFTGVSGNSFAGYTNMDSTHLVGNPLTGEDADLNIFFDAAPFVIDRNHANTVAQGRDERYDGYFQSGWNTADYAVMVQQLVDGDYKATYACGSPAGSSIDNRVVFSVGGSATLVAADGSSLTNNTGILTLPSWTDFETYFTYTGWDGGDVNTALKVLLATPDASKNAVMNFLRLDKVTGKAIRWWQIKTSTEKRWWTMGADLVVHNIELTCYSTLNDAGASEVDVRDLVSRVMSAFASDSSLNVVDRYCGYDQPPSAEELPEREMVMGYLCDRVKVSLHPREEVSRT